MDMKAESDRLNGRLISQLQSLCALTDIRAAGYKSMDEAVRKLLAARERELQRLEKQAGL